jgi:cytochrome c-type biogenesis protein CcmH
VNQKSFRNLIILITLMISLIPVSTLAQTEVPTDDEVNAIAKQLFCPVCENIPLDACGTAACEQWRGIIRDKLAEGWTEQQIKNYFVEQYGDRVLAEPPAKGFNWVVYLVPGIIFLVGVYSFYRGFQNWRGVAASGKPRSQERSFRTKKPSDKYISLVEEELRKRSEE